MARIIQHICLWVCAHITTANSRERKGVIASTRGRLFRSQPLVVVVAVSSANVLNLHVLLQRSRLPVPTWSIAERYSGFLHFAVRQQPDQRLIVKIDNLNTVAPRITKVAPERRFQF
jgi:hypothetical protein